MLWIQIWQSGRNIMNQKIDNLRTNLQTKLDEIASQVEKVKGSLKVASKEAEETIKSKMNDTKAKLESKKQEIADSKAKLEERIQTKKSEVASQIADWKTKREQDKLVARANRAEEYAAAAILLALAAIDEAEVATLEAVAARMDADEVVGN